MSLYTDVYIHILLIEPWAINVTFLSQMPYNIIYRN